MEAMAGKDKEAIILSVGQPHFSVPPAIKRKIRQAISKNLSGYAPTDGTNEVLSSIKTFLQIESENDDLLLTAGGSESLAIALLAILNPNDEVIIFAPYYPGYPPLIEICGGVVKTHDLRKNNFELTALEVEKALSEKTKAIIINSPNNPTGKIISSEEVQKIAELVKKKEIFLISDEIYHLYDYKNKFTSFLPYINDNQHIILGSFSKTLFATGYRLGYLIAGNEIKKRCKLIHQYLMVAVSTPLQEGLRQLNVSSVSRYLVKSRAVYQKNCQLIKVFLEKWQIDYIDPEGAFYFFINIAKFGFSSLLISKRIFDLAKIVVTPGIAFGKDYDDFIRISYAISQKDLKKAIKRIEKVLMTL